MNKIKLKYLKIKWLKQFKKLIKNQSNDYYKNTLSKLYDFDTETSLFSISFFDTVNNRELNKLIKKIHRLKKNKNYKIDVSYRAKNIKNINYIHPQFDYTGSGSVATIAFLNDYIFSRIEMSWSQINNDEAIIQYVVYLKKVITSFETIHNFIIKNYKMLKHSVFTPFYFDIKFFKREQTQCIDTELKYFRVIVQSKLKKFAYSHNLKRYLLPIKFTYLFNKKTTNIMKYIKSPLLEESFIIDDDHYFIINNLEEIEGAEINEFIFKKSFNPIDFVHIFSQLRMPLYYKLFYNIEKYELEKRITKYLNSNKIIINFWDYKWLLNKNKRINEKRFYKLKYENKIKCYSRQNGTLLDYKLLNGIKNVYSENIDFIKNINSLNYNILTFIISFVALIVAIICIFN